MPGNSPLSRTLDQALYESYSQGRAHSGGSLGGSKAQWSAVNDSRTCDFCDYADLKIFDVKTGAWDPPVHWGCRCLIAYIRSDEFQPDLTWGGGPPDSAFPPGSISETVKASSPKDRNLIEQFSRSKDRSLARYQAENRAQLKGGTVENFRPLSRLERDSFDQPFRYRYDIRLKPGVSKPSVTQGVKKPPARTPAPAPKVPKKKIKPGEPRSVGDTFRVDTMKSRQEIEKFLKSEYNINADLTAWDLRRHKTQREPLRNS